MKVGKSNFGGQKKVFKIEDGDNVYRVLPPLGDLADSGRWSVYYAIQWGFKDSKGRQRPFEDCRVINFKTKMVEVESPAYQLREKLNSEKEAIVEKFKAGDLTQDQVKELVKPINEKIKRFNLDAKHYLNVVNLKGEIGLLKLNSTLMKSLRAAIKKQTDKGVDPTSVDHGVYFTFSRENETGKIQDYVFSVSPYLENQEDGSFREKIHVMDEAFFARLSTEARDLSKLYKKPTPEEIQEMIDTGATEDGSPVVDRVLGSSDDSGDSSDDSEESSSDSSSTPSTPSSQAAAAPTEETKTEVKAETTTTPEAKTETKVETQTETKAEESGETTPTPGSGKDMSNDDFLKSIGAL